MVRLTIPRRNPFRALLLGVGAYLLPTPEGQEWADWAMLFLIAISPAVTLLVRWLYRRGY